MSPAGPVTCSWLWTQTRGRASSRSSRPSGWSSERCAAAASCSRSIATARWKSWRSVVVIAGVLAGATDDDLVLLDRHLDGPMTGPVLCVDRAVGDLRIEPEAVALLAVVERPLVGRLAPGRAGAPAAPAAAPATALGPVLLLVGLFVLVVLVGARGLCLELRSDQRVVLGAQVDLIVEVDPGDALRRLALRRKLVLALEGRDLGRRHLELMRDP